MKKLLTVILVLALMLSAIPLTVAFAEKDDAVFIVADGVTYRVQQGEIFHYVYYFSTGEQLCSLDGEFFYDPAGLEVIIPENEDDLGMEMLFPRLKYSIMTNEITPGRLKYNYSNAKGKAFDKESYLLIDAQIKVTASAGEYEIRNVLHTVAGADEVRYLYKDQVIKPFVRSESDIPDKQPYDPNNPEPDPTEPPTQEPTPTPTELPTQAPTPAPTQPPTQEPTPAPTEPPTQAPTPAPTEPPTQEPTPAPTEPATDAPDDKLILGDVDGDGKVTIYDASAIQRRLSGDTKIACNEALGDVDGDGKFTIYDASEIQRFLAGMPAREGIGKPKG